MVSEIVYIFFEATCAFGKNVYDYEFGHASNPLVVVSTSNVQFKQSNVQRLLQNGQHHCDIVIQVFTYRVMH